MTRRIYSTEALVLASRNIGENTQVLTLLTPALGLIEATAQGLRELKSKLRYGLQLFNLAGVSLVRGREVWRLTNAEPEINFAISAGHEAKLVLIGRVVSLLKRLIRGEEPQPELFADCRAGLFFLTQTELNEQQLRVYELVLVLRLLHRLGYAENRPELLPLLNFTVWSETVFAPVALLEGMILDVVNQALKHSQL